jgi:hypothetical protein
MSLNMKNSINQALRQIDWLKSGMEYQRMGVREAELLCFGYKINSPASKD